MSQPTNRRRDPGGASSESILIWVGIALVVSVVGSIYGAVHLGHRFANTGASIPSDPVTLGVGLFGGDVAWPGTAGWVVLGVELVAAIALVVLVALGLRALGRKRTRVDRAAAYMGRGRDVEALGRKSAASTAGRLGVTGSPGVPIGRAIAGGQLLYGSWEDMHIDVWGPRTGKTTSRAVPAILDAPGAVLVTSNKRDEIGLIHDTLAGSTRSADVASCSQLPTCSLRMRSSIAPSKSR